MSVGERGDERDRTAGEPGGERAGRVPLSDVLERNIGALIARRRAEEKAQPRKDRLAERIGRFAGSMTFVAIHAIAFLAWVLVNVGPGAGPPI